MTILFLDQFSEMGGAQRCLLDLVPATLQRGWQPRVAVPGDGPLVRHLRELNIPVERIVLGPFTSGAKTISDSLRFMKDTAILSRSFAGADLIYVNGPRLLPAVALASPRCPVIFHCHSLLNEGPAARLARWALRRTRAAVIASCRFVTRWFPDLPSRVIYSGVPDLALPIGPRPGDPVIAVIGRIAPEKGQLTFVRAARLLLREQSRVRFLICGSPLFSDPSYHRIVLAEAAGLPIEFLPWRDDLSAVWQSLSALAVPSAPSDAAPRVVLEARAAGVPVVAFPSGGIPELVQDGVTGHLVVPSTPEALAAKLSVILANDQAGIRSAARAAWARRFTLDRYREEICDVIVSRSSTLPLASADTRALPPAPASQSTPLPDR